MDIAQLLGIEDRLVSRVQKMSDIVFQAIRESEIDIIPSPVSIHLSDPSSPVQLPLQSMPSFYLSPLPTVPASSLIIPVPTSTTAIAPLQRTNAVTSIIASTATSSISSPTPSSTTKIAHLQRTNEVTAVIASTATTYLSSQTPSSTNLSPISTSSVRPVPAMMSAPAATLQSPITANLPSLPTESVFKPPATIRSPITTSSTLPTTTVPFSARCLLSPIRGSTPVSHPTSTTTEAQSEVARYYPSPLSVVEHYVPTLANTLLQTHAKALLVSGAMPLLPPSKRDWSSVPDEAITLVQGLRWPPKAWRNLSPDCRLLALEFAATSILQSTAVSWSITNRCLLVHQFQHLMLPGTASILLDSSGKARHYLSETVREIVSGVSSLPPEVKSQILRTLPDHQDDPLLSIIKDIPVRP
ncbi:mucin-2-like [Dreissena polymorpha]|uniref:Uncharacterized protein n=1 Tax=Dreissena polymorpha TaxID=45954 RepID=A0A9D3YMA3_DREPO|nr:mucin-2-like [Dreissena polymorpha]KAH3703182.1 hypothetical protein DPMN_078213 [Dreissena polymorpha]